MDNILKIQIFKSCLKIFGLNLVNIFLDPFRLLTTRSQYFLLVFIILFEIMITSSKEFLKLKLYPNLWNMVFRGLSLCIKRYFNTVCDQNEHHHQTEESLRTRVLQLNQKDLPILVLQTIHNPIASSQM